MKFKKFKLVIGIGILILNINLFSFIDVQGGDPIDISMVESCSIPCLEYPYGLTWNGTHFCGMFTKSEDPGIHGIYIYDHSGNLKRFINYSNARYFQGLAWDGNYFWTTGDQKIVKFDSATETIIDEFTVNFDTCGLTYDGMYLWVVDGLETHKIYKINLTTQIVADSFPHPYYPAQSFGLEYIDGYLWFSTVGSGGTGVHLCRINPESHEYDIVYKLTDAQKVWGITYDGIYLWAILDDTSIMQAYDIITLEEDNDGDGSTNQDEKISGYVLWLIFGIFFVFITIIIKRKLKSKI